jgi:hypothetical protein
MPLHTFGFQLCTTLYLTQIYIYPLVVTTGRYILLCKQSGMNGWRLTITESKVGVFVNTINARLQNDSYDIGTGPGREKVDGRSV